MFDKLIDIKNKAIDRAKSIGLVRGLQIGSGIAVVIGTILVNIFNDDNLMATDILESYESDTDKNSSESNDDDEPIIEVD